ncbi:uncharacterized protein LOC124433734 isoform X2 [Xenia sp. Carnegie-2017]|nr:uncharacterized protein LOC124433734 isoform X2 [Xenia sp. Carnegie-2017]
MKRQRQMLTRSTLVVQFLICLHVTCTAITVEEKADHDVRYNIESSYHNVVNNVNRKNLEKFKEDKHTLHIANLKKFRDQSSIRKSPARHITNLRDNTFKYNDLSDKQVAYGDFTHRIFKRNANPNVNVTISPPPLPPPPPPKIPPPLPPKIPPPPPLPIFNVPPVCEREKSCSGRCTGNKTDWRSNDGLSCYCDVACYEIFNDCCADYVKYCGEQKNVEIPLKKFNWTCESLGHYDARGQCQVGNGLWMISRCAHDWPYDIIRSKCEQPVTTLKNASGIARYLPAIKYDLVFRNHFCALCNRIKGDFEYFPLRIKTSILPPNRYSFEKKINFLLMHGAEFPRSGPQKPKTNQTRRYCLKTIVNSCQNDKRNDTCRNGSVSIISIFGRYYKNYECALCNNPLGPYQCFPDFFSHICMSTPPQKFTLNLDYGNITSKLTLHRSCSGYDVRLEECVQLLPIPTGNKDSFRILTWLSPSENDRFNKNDFKGIMNQYYGIESSQIQNISIQTVLRVFGLPSYSGTPILYHLVLSTIVLTPEQSFNIYYNTSSSSKNLQELIYFKQSNAITWNNITYTIIKTTSRPLSCVGKKIYDQRSYTVIDDDKIQINSTGKTYERSQYYGDIGNDVVVCEEYMPNGCQLTKVGLTKDDVTIYKNLALKVKNTRMFYDRGNYEVSNGLISLCKTRGSSTPTCSTQMSCKGRCSNKTEWRNIVEMTCSCDPDCHEVFGDCCSDYTKYCGAQTTGETRRKTFNYTCENFGKYDSAFCTVADGVWMVSGCTYEWPRDSTRSKCEIPIKRLP